MVSDDRERWTSRPVSDIVPDLARELLLEPEPPARLPTVRDLAVRHRASLSSIHSAMGRLRELGAIDVETRGPLGAFMVDRSIGKLWEAIDGGPLVIALPLASSPRYEALATALKHGLTAVGLEVFLIFVRGSRQRLQAVRDGRCDLAVMSAFASGELCGPDDAVVQELWPHSYNTGHLVFFTERARTARPIRVLVDRHSADQQLLSALEFAGDGVTMVPAMTAQIARMLADGRGDAAVWTADEMLVNRPPGLFDRPLSPAVIERIGDRDTRAVLVGRAADADILRATTTNLAGPEAEQMQTDVLAGVVTPEY
jgi:hypothetical protein